MKFSSYAAEGASAAKKKPDLKQLGATGTTFYGGFVSGVEHNVDLTGESGLTIMERMFRSDATARGVERSVTLPIRAARMNIEPASDKPIHREIAEFEEAALRRLLPSWEHSLRQILLYLRYGYYLLEPVWILREGKYEVERLAPRPPRTVYRWYIDEHGDTAGVSFRVWVPQTYGMGKIPAGATEYIDIPAERLLHFVNDPEGGSPVGESIGRPMYKAWKMKETIELITMIGIEKGMVGTEYAQMGPKATNDDGIGVARVLRSLHANSQGYMIMPDKSIVDTFGVFGQTGGRGSGSGGLPLLDYHRREMCLSFLAGFLTLGDNGGGSQAQSRDKSSFFLLALKSIADYVADTFTRDILSKLTYYNFPGTNQDDVPRMVFSHLETRNMAEFAAAVVSMAGAGALSIDRVVRAAIRAELDFPDEPDEIADKADIKAGWMDPPAPEPDPNAPTPPPADDTLPPADDGTGIEPPPDDGSDNPPNLLLSRDDDEAERLATYAVDPAKYSVTPDPTSKLGYKVIDLTTGHRLVGYAAIKVKQAIDALRAKPAGKGKAAPKGTTAKGGAAPKGKAGPDPVKVAEKAAKDAKREQAAAERKAKQAATEADKAERRAMFDKRRGESDTRREARDARMAADRTKREADQAKSKADAAAKAAKTEAGKSKRATDQASKAAQRESDKAAKAGAAGVSKAEKATIDAAKSERDGLQTDVAKLDPKAARDKLTAAGWEPAGGGAGAADAQSEARTVAAAHPDKIVTVVQVKGASIVVTKPKSKFVGGKAANELAMADPEPDAEDEASYEIDDGAGDDLTGRFDAAAKRLAPLLFVDRGDGEDDEGA